PSPPKGPGQHGTAPPSPRHGSTTSTSSSSPTPSGATVPSCQRQECALPFRLGHSVAATGPAASPTRVTPATTPPARPSPSGCAAATASPPAPPETSDTLILPLQPVVTELSAFVFALRRRHRIRGRLLSWRRFNQHRRPRNMFRQLAAD